MERKGRVEFLVQLALGASFWLQCSPVSLNSGPRRFWADGAGVGRACLPDSPPVPCGENPGLQAGGLRGLNTPPAPRLADNAAVKSLSVTNCRRTRSHRQTRAAGSRGHVVSTQGHLPGATPKKSLMTSQTSGTCGNLQASRPTDGTGSLPERGGQKRRLMKARRMERETRKSQSVLKYKTDDTGYNATTRLPVT